MKKKFKDIFKTKVDELLDKLDNNKVSGVDAEFLECLVDLDERVKSISRRYAKSLLIDLARMLVCGMLSLYFVYFGGSLFRDASYSADAWLYSVGMASIFAGLYFFGLFLINIKELKVEK